MFLRCVGKIGQQSEINVPIAVGQIAHFQMPSIRFSMPAHAAQHGRHDDHGAVFRRNAIRKIQCAASNPGRTKRVANQFTIETASWLARRAARTPASPSQPGRGADEHCERSNANVKRGGDRQRCRRDKLAARCLRSQARPRRKVSVPPRVPGLQRLCRADNSRHAPAGGWHPCDRARGQLDGECGDLLFPAVMPLWRFARRRGDRRRGCRSPFPDKHPPDRRASVCSTTLRVFHKLAPIHRVEKTQAGDAVADGNLIGGLVLAFALHHLFDGQAFFAQPFFDPAQDQFDRRDFSCMRRQNSVTKALSHAVSRFGQVADRQ